MEQLLPDLLLGDRVQDRTGRVHRRRFPGRSSSREQGAIAYADKLVESLKTERHVRRLPARRPGAVQVDGKGYVAVPWQLDMRAFCGTASRCSRRPAWKCPPTGRQLLEAGKALKKIGVFGFATGTGAGNNFGYHSMVMMMIINGGGVFTQGRQAGLS